MQHSRWRGVSKDKVVGAFRTAAAEMWLFALADYHIMSRRSGFGRISSYMSGRWHQLYAVLRQGRSGLWCAAAAEPVVLGDRF